MAFFDSGPVRLFYTDDGKGEPTMVFVHGFACDSHDWSWQLPHFREKHRSIAVDLRGHGRSSAPASGYSVVDFAEDLAGLLDHLSAAPVIALGHSMGASVVSALAIEHPELVTALVCVDPAYLIPDEIGPLTRELLDAVRSGDPVLVVQQIFAGLESPALPAAIHTWHRRRAAGTPAHVLRQTLESQLGNATLYSQSVDYLSRRSCPVLAFYGDPGRGNVEQLLFNDDRSHAVTWEGAGHWLHLERPTEFNALVESWIESF
jgi:pimeloyl-ACP methyl ester carboxylesterase